MRPKESVALGINSASMLQHLDACGQFNLYILSLEEQRLSALRQQGIGAFEQIIEWRERPGGHDLHRFSETIHKVLDPDGVDLRGAPR